MKNLFLTAVVVLLGSSSSVFADGFRCEGQDTGTRFKIFNHTDASQGTRKVAVMAISDPRVNAGRKTIASFKDVKSTLSNGGTSYTAKVDLRVSESNRAGENIAGTKLGELASIRVDVFFNYNHDTPSYDGQMFKGKVDYNKRNGEVLSEKLDCKRYLKN